MRTNDADKILIVSLCNDFSKQVANILSQSLGMMFCDIDDLVAYELIDQDKMKELTSREYLAERERKVMKHFASFENVVGTTNYQYYVSNCTILSQKTLVVFVKLPKSYIKEVGDEVDVLAFDDRTEKMEAVSDFVVAVKKVDEKFVCEKIIEVLRKTL